MFLESSPAWEKNLCWKHVWVWHPLACAEVDRESPTLGCKLFVCLDANLVMTAPLGPIAAYRCYPWLDTTVTAEWHTSLDQRDRHYFASWIGECTASGKPSS